MAIGDTIRRIYQNKSNPLKRLWNRASGQRTRRGRHRWWVALRKWAARKRLAFKNRKDWANAKLWRKRRDIYARKAKASRPPEVNFKTSAGSPHWGGAEDILDAEVDPLVARLTGLKPNSGKRSPCYGNCSSDHHVSQSTASAHDYPTANNYSLAQKVRSKLSSGTHSDYANFYFTYKGVRYRGQIIAGTHGTGPHLHVGIRRA